MYTGTIALQQCSYCPALRGPGQLKPFATYSKGVETSRYHACEKCAEMIEVMMAMIAVEAMKSKCQQP